jgi:hypothetical protein
MEAVAQSVVALGAAGHPVNFHGWQGRTRRGGAKDCGGALV